MNMNFNTTYGKYYMDMGGRLDCPTRAVSYLTEFTLFLTCTTQQHITVYLTGYPVILRKPEVAQIS